MDSHISARTAVAKLRKRFVANGGFSVNGTGPDRPDATAWGAILLTILGQEPGMLAAARRRLVQSQLDDGRLGIAPDQSSAFWPTPLAILAWSTSRNQQNNRRRAARFLLKTSGTHWPKQLNSLVGHDTSLRGWPWNADTHSWVETTASSIIALEVAGYGNHPRVREGIELLLDRQLSHGGWNYGNTIILGRELRPAPEYTGAALAALAGRVPESSVARSIEYLRRDISHRRTPIAVGWGVLGLSAWHNRPPDAADRMAETLEREKRFGRYDTASLCLLLSAYFAKYGLKETLRDRIDSMAASHREEMSLHE